MTAPFMRMFLALALASVLHLLNAARLTSEGMEAYDTFRQQYGKTASSHNGVADYSTRLSIFERSRAFVQEHNSKRSSWVAGLNEFADYTHDERQALLGYKRHVRSSSAVSSGMATSFLEVQEEKEKEKTLAESVDWRQKVNASRQAIHNQGACGSCWALAAATALEMHMELATGQFQPLSYEELVDCVPNPKHCGGTGGCKGATAELALAYVKSHGLGFASAYKGYASGGDGTCRPPTQPAIRIENFQQLPVNQLQPLMEAVAHVGPVAASVDASDWSFYSSGVFDGCKKDATVNHAILLVGYGTKGSDDKDYWLIRNSWGSGWGEVGYIRLQRHPGDTGDKGYCGIDHNPKDGNACDGAEPTMPVCGMCGILSDSSYPIGVQVVSQK